MHDNLGDRMKKNYENITRTFLPRRTYTIIRLDGKAFHTFTRGLNRPWDEDLIDIMNDVTKSLCANIQGAKLGYTQSDEITIVMTDFDSLETDAWYGGNIQKIVSVSASMATAYFATFMNKKSVDSEELNGTSKWWGRTAMFDARTYTIPSRNEVINNLVWRQKDAERNSVQMLAQSLYSQKKLNGKNIQTQKEMCLKEGKDWETDAADKRGRMLYLQTKWKMSADSFDEPYAEREWIWVDDCPIFTENWGMFDKILPVLE